MFATNWMGKPLAAITVAAAILAFASPVSANPEVGKPAPEFSGVDANGKTWKLTDLRGKTVVLEWTNDGCPYVQKHYNSGNMQSLQQGATSDGVVWLTVASSAEGTQGYLNGEKANALTASRKAAPTAILLDATGSIGKAYDAEVTPHMYVIDKTGALAFMGGIDNNPSADPSTIKGAKNHVRAALDDLKAGKSVAQAITRPYGCSIKYKS
ncbi:MAG: thioredoxin family protein [Hyphomicrobiales bacterium]|nr:thioredoxin family protein [Hyphomicrobiales bacterium]